MRKKVLMITSVILVLLVIAAICVGLKSCSNSSNSSRTDGENIVEKDDADKDSLDEERVGTDTADASELEDDNTGTDVDTDIANVSDIGSDDKENTASDSSETDSSGKNGLTTESSDKDGSAGTNNSSGNTTISKKKYTITYILNNENATIKANTQTVTYGEAFTLETPTSKDDYSFVKWVITGTTTEFKSGVYNVDGDISLTAVWQDTYSKNY